MSSSVRYLKGVGPVRARKLERLGIFSVSDLVHHYPRDYQRRQQVRIGDLPHYAGETVIVCGRVLDQPRELRRKVTVLTARIADSTGSVRCTWFNQSYLKSQLLPGTALTVAGKYSREYRNIVVEEYKFGGPLPEILPLYSLTEGISNQTLAGLIRRGLEEHDEPEIFPADFRSKYRLFAAQQALNIAHCPTGEQELAQALETIKFTELFLYQLSFLYWRNLRERQKGYAHRLRPELLGELEAAFGFKFTPDQAQAIAEIERDLLRPQPMNRLLQGDVGSGKTAVAAHALITSALNGYKAVLMVPTEIVARQHFSTLHIAAKNYPFSLHLLTGSTKKTDRDVIQASLQAAGGVILVGTHAVFQEGVKIDGLALVVTDEQHRFGVQQRFALTEKGENPHVLAMSATPIPRTMAMTIYGDLDVSTLQNKPKGRREIKTYVIPDRSREKVFAFISREMDKGNSGYIVCPLIEESDKINALSLEKYQEVLARGLPRRHKFGVLHGRLTGEEKERIISLFQEGEIQLLLATTVVEVGVDVADATFVVVENSERFGLAQLHQLRGRVGRRDKQSYCFLISSGGETERLKILEQTNDGFAVALADLKIRGSGQFLGSRQHGVNEFRLADVILDAEIAIRARRAAAEATVKLAHDPEWQRVLEIVMKNIANLKS